MKSMVCAVLAGTIVLAAAPALAVPVVLAFSFTLTDLDYKPLAGVPVRVVFDSDPKSQQADAGHRPVTDAKGETRWEAQVELQEQMKKVPTNFVGSLLSGPQRAQFLRVAAEMTYFEQPWLYTVDLYRFAGGDTLQDDSAVYTRDERGAFTRKAKRDKNGWTMADMGGLVLTMPGFEACNFALDPDPADPTHKRRTLKLAFKKAPAPIRR
jgi:hypothetical protein